MWIGERLSAARKWSGLTLKQVEELTGVGTSSISEYESGAREPKLSQLSKLAKVYNRSVSFLLEEGLPVKETVLWRQKPESPKSEQIESQFLNLCEEYHLLEQWCGESRVSEIPVSSYPKNEFGYPEAEKLAYEFRTRCALGDRPGLSLLRIAEEVCGIKVFHLDFKPTGVAACTLHDVFGPAVLLNSGNVPWRRNFDLAHEIFHLITWRSFRSDNNNQEPTEFEEKLATCFARNLLMPPEVFKASLSRIKGDLCAAHVFDIAREFDVSHEAVVYHARFVTDDKDDAWVENLITDCRRKYDTYETRPKNSTPPSSKPSRYHNLAIKAFTKGELSVSRFSKMMDISRSEAMKYQEGEPDGKTQGSYRIVR